MIAVPFFGLVGAIFETGAIYFRTAQLQVATEVASRSLLTRSLAAGMTYKQFVDNNVCTWQALGVVKPGTLSTMFDCSKVMVDIRKPVAWGAVDTTGADFYNNPPAGGSAINLPGPGEIVVVRIAYPMSVITGLLGGGAFKGQSFGKIRAGEVQYNGNWTNMLIGITAFRAEP